MRDKGFGYESVCNLSYLIYRLEDTERIDSVEHNMITNNEIDGLLSVNYASIDGDCCYKYDISSKIPLNRYISGGCDKEKIIKILINTLNIFIKIEDYLILKEHIVLDENFIFVDVRDISLYFVCLPVESNSRTHDLTDFVNNIIKKLNSEEFESKGLLNILKDYVNNEGLPDIKEALNILKSLSTKTAAITESAQALNSISQFPILVIL